MNWIAKLKRLLQMTRVELEGVLTQELDSTGQSGGEEGDGSASEGEEAGAAEPEGDDDSGQRLALPRGGGSTRGPCAPA